MLWPVLILCAVALIGLVHFWWRAKFLRAEGVAQKEIQKLVTAQEQSALQHQMQQEALFNSMAEGLLLLDQEGRIHLANRAFLRLFGIASEIRSRTVMEAFRSHELAELVEKIGAQKQVVGSELKLSGPPERFLEVNGAGIFSETGDRRGTILVFHDLTRLKQLERNREEFVANVSHELRTPLSLIKGYVETLLEGAKDNPEVAAKFLQTIDRNAERLKLLIEDLLTISELESGRLKLNTQPLALNQVIDKVLADFKTRAELKQARLLSLVPELRVCADSDRLEQVLANLIDNALKYGRPEGTVSVSARPEGAQVEVCVSDDGPGIPPDALERIFERFYRVDKARSREQGGTGLGLSIVKHIIQNHGGRVWATSTVGQGAAFCFTLPRDN